MSCKHDFTTISGIEKGVKFRQCWKCNKKIYIKTNADRIRAMSDEEMAEFLCDFRTFGSDMYACEGCKANKYCYAEHRGTYDWLKKPAEGE